MSDSVWYRLGYSLERVRRSPMPGRLASLAERSLPERASSNGDQGEADVAPELPGADALLEGLGVAALGRIVAGRKLGLGAALRGMAIGAGAEVARLLAARLRGGDPTDSEIADGLLRGAAHGVIYGTLLGPVAPGAGVGKGLLYGAASWMASARGGLPALLGAASPHRHVPGLAAVVGPDDPEAELVDHLVFGMVLAILYESSRDRSGTASGD